MTLKKYQTGGKTSSITLDDGSVHQIQNTYMKDGKEMIDLDGYPMTIDRYKSLLNAMLFTTNREKSTDKYTAEQIANQPPLEKPIINLVDDGTGQKKVVVENYYIDDKGNKVKGFKPPIGSIPRKESGGVKMYQKGGFNIDPKAIDLALNNPYGYEPGSRAFNRYQNFLDKPFATRNVQADMFNPTLNISATPFSTGKGGSGRINYNPALVRAGQDQNWVHGAGGGEDRGQFRFGPNLTHVSGYRQTPTNVPGINNPQSDYGINRTTLGANFAYQHPLNRSGSLVAGGDLELGTMLGGSNTVQGYPANLAHRGATNLDMSGLPTSESGYGQVRAGLGYYPKDKNWGIRGNIGYGTERSSMPGLNYGVTANYGASQFGLTRDRLGTGLTFGVGLPIGMGNRKSGTPGYYDYPPYRRQTGGMYGQNTLSAAGQGSIPEIGTTSTIVGQETDPALQEARIAGLEQQGAQLGQEATGLGRSIVDQAAQDKQIAEQEALQGYQQSLQQTGQIKGMAERGARFGASQMFPEHVASQSASIGSALRTGAEAWKAQRAVNQAIAAGAPMSSAGTAGSAGLQAFGQGMGKWAKSPGGIGTIANLAGMGIRKLSDDDDPTHSNVGEYAGRMISGAGQGFAIGSMIPIPGANIAGAVIGAGVGATQEALGSKRARRDKAEYEAEATAARNAGIYDLNERVGSLYGSHLANVAAGNLAQKTFSGQNLGRNVMYKGGGFMLGMPRYGY
jgi:hypothetical protein